MKPKIIGILVCMLLIATALPAVGTLNIEQNYTNIKLSSESTIVWSDDFDSYAAGSLLHGQGGWEAWFLNTLLSPYVSDGQSRSVPNSVDINWRNHTWSDIVHLFYWVNSGQWTITAWWFLPEEFTGCSGFLLFNKYEHNVNPVIPRDSSLGLTADSDAGTIHDYWGGGETLPLIRDEWVEIRVEIDFDIDTMDVYYNNTLLESKSWTEGDGQKNLACINLCNDLKPSNATYFDDISLEGDVSENPDLYCEGDITLTKVEPGETVVESFIVQNSGAEGTLLDWEIESTPDWGTWSFEPNEGDDLESWSPITIDVEIVAPEDPVTKFTGDIVLVNSEDPDDTCTISVSLTTPMNQQIDINPLFQRILERFPNAFPILRYLLGL